MSEIEMECDECGWLGYVAELVCSEEDGNASDKPLDEIKFNRCPNCGSLEVYDVED